MGTCDTEPSPGGGANRKNRRRPQCYYCHAYGHIKKHCRKLAGPMEPVNDAPPHYEQRMSAIKSEMTTIKQFVSQMTANMRANMGEVAQKVRTIQQIDQLQYSGHRADSHQHHPAPATGSGPMEPVSQQQARQQPLAATHRGTSEKQNVHLPQQTNQPRAQYSGHLADSHRRHPAPATVEQRLGRLE